MTVCYLDVDDEITDAVARLRTTSDRRFILVLPPGSRVATSRINFRLLSREAQEREVVVGMVSSEPGVRALAISAGMPAYARVDEAETSLEWPADDQAQALLAARDAPPALPTEPMVEQARRAAGPSLPSARISQDAGLEATRILPRSGASVGVAGGGPVSVGAASRGPANGGVATRAGAQSDPSPVRQRPRADGRTMVSRLVGLAVVAAVLGGVLYAAYLYLPNVSVSLTPMSRPAGPVSVEVTADPAVAVADPGSGIVPAERIDVPLSATDQFAATGSEVEEIRATGSVRFTSENTLFEVPIPEGTRLTTTDGAAFETTLGVTISQASFQSGPSTVKAPVRAVDPGPAGNVEAATITALPQPIVAQLVRVTNPQATSGGERVETLVVTRADYDAAVAELQQVLDSQLASALADPETTPRGLRLFPETAAREQPTMDVAAGDLVGQAVEVFSLSAASRGTVLAVEESAIAEIAADQLAASMAPGARLFPDSVVTTMGEPRIVGGRIVYEVEAAGQLYEPIDHSELVAAIRGRTVSEARAILDSYGSVSITPWPDFIDTVPDDARRIDLTVLEPQQRSP